ncbi:MAG: hypothetical protein LBR92_02930 [Puniceicoccales bacterium]|jgi:hypothetical protein|nr:hypothetical protein [Puniceicoccales bacterium]
MSSVAIDRIGGTLARQATNVGGVGGGTMLEGVIPPFKMGSGGEFDAMLNVTSSSLGGISGGLNHVARRSHIGRVAAVGMATPSGKIVHAVQSVRDQFLTIQSRVEALCSKKADFSSADLLEMQYHVMQLAYLNELSSKVADKTSQGAQTLFRNQG